MAELCLRELRATMLEAKAQELLLKAEAIREAPAKGVPAARITIDLQPDGRGRIVSTCMGRPDSSYVPVPDVRLPGEVCKLVAELRERLSGVTLK